MGHRLGEELIDVETCVIYARCQDCQLVCGWHPNEIGPYGIMRESLAEIPSCPKPMPEKRWVIRVKKCRMLEMDEVEGMTLNEMLHHFEPEYETVLVDIGDWRDWKVENYKP